MRWRINFLISGQQYVGIRVALDSKSQSTHCFIGQADLEIPALVIAMEGDPATPIAWGPGLVDSIGDAVLISSDGDGHGAFLTNSECVTEVVFRYLTELVVPRNGWSCEEP